jgi:formylglycine-generating enzyme required for sulfatase activity
MLASAAELQQAFGVDSGQFGSLAPEARFNLSLLEIRRHMQDASEDRLRPLVAQLTAAARELKDPTVATDLSRRLARLGEKEPFAAAARGDEFTLKPAGADVPVTFHRIKPQGRRPFFLATTELSFAQFSAIVSANTAWDDLRSLVWSPQPGELGDPRRGPRVWEWVMRPAPQMYPTQLWLFPEEANDFPEALRDPRVGKFNSAVLREAAGGMPSDRHPVQYVPPVAAIYVAGLAGCRLPTTAEWRAAYDGFEKAVPAAEWNLRDQTWQLERDRLAKVGSAGGENGNRGPHAADDGIYLPPAPKVATGASAKALPHRDGTLFFRPADGPGGRTFRHLVGNVAEIVCDASEPFEQLTDRTAQRVRVFAADPSVALFVIGGSALSPPESPNDEPLPVKPDGAYADVGFRLAFTAPSKNLAEKLEWVLAGQGFVAPGAAAKGDKTASAEKAPPQS